VNFIYMEVGMRRNPKAELQRHRRWTQHRRGWPHYPFRGSYYRHMQKHLNRSERHAISTQEVFTSDLGYDDWDEDPDAMRANGFTSGRIRSAPRPSEVDHEV
jgi:hypothetical protein